MSEILFARLDELDDAVETEVTSQLDAIFAAVAGDVTFSGTSPNYVSAIGATKVTSAMLNSDVFSTAHTWSGQQTFVAPILGTPASGTLTNTTGFPVANLAGAGTGVLAALAVNIGSAGAPVLFNGALGTPSSGTVTNLTGTASININGTVGATTPATGAFTTLTTSGNVGIGVAADANAKLKIVNNVATGFLDTFAEYQILLNTQGTAADSYGLGVRAGFMVFNTGTGGGFAWDITGATTAMTLSNAGNLTIAATTATSSTSTGALIVGGGVGVGGRIRTGDAVVVGTGTGSMFASINGGTGTAEGAFFSLQKNGTEIWLIGHRSAYSGAGTSSNLVLAKSGVGVGIEIDSTTLAISLLGALSTSSTTASTSTTTGSGIFAGGVGIGGRLNAAGFSTIGLAISGAPASSGSAQTNGILRIQTNPGATLNNVLDVGGYGSGQFSMWLQVANQTNLASNLPLSLQPNGGGVSIGLGDVDPGSTNLRIGGSLATKSPVSTGTSYTMLVGDSSIIFTNAGGSSTLTLLSAATYPGRDLLVKTTEAQTVVSASSNVVPKVGGAAGTAILPATDGAWAFLKSDGTNWVIMASGT